MEWNRTGREYPRDKCVHQVFAEQAERTPDAVAVAFEESTLTYRELNLRADQLAHHLQSLGVGPNTLVGLCVERSLEMLIALLGILKAGGAYWALEDDLPEERLRQMLAEARPKLLLADGKTISRFSGLAHETAAVLPPIVAIEEILASPAAPVTVHPSLANADSPAYVSYTSGSTGQPKGVVVPHRGVVRLVKNTDYASLTEDETLLHLSSLAFDASTFEIWGALLNGGRVALLPSGPISLADIGVAIRRHRVTTLWLTAGLFHLMVDERLEDLKPLRQLLAGGDVLSPDHVRKFRRAHPHCRIINGYGPTENTTFTCCHRVEGEPDLTHSVPIGRPIANTQVYILDSSLQPVPIGVAGELHAGGDGLALGYLDQPQLTAERFIPNPFSGKLGARLYRTGDLARWREDGTIEFLGRIGTQVKIRGFRVEVGEIESALRAQPEIREAVVVASDDMPGFKRLLCYLVPQSADRPAIAILRERLAWKLPEYMLPSAAVWLDQLPLTPNGKVNRKALPAPEIERVAVTDAISQPASLLELQLARIWERLLLVKNIGRQDNFFSLGGHSLMAARLVAELDKLLGCKIPIATLFQSPTIELLAARLTDDHWAPPWSSLVPLQPEGTKPPLFFIHGAGGDVYAHLTLARLLPPDQPAYGIQAVGLDGKTARHTTVEEMAAHYVKELISFQPDGPVCLTGFSMGGLIAYEMAQQLQRQGRQVVMLALLDTAPVRGIPWFFYGYSMTIYIPNRCLFHFRRWLKMSHEDKRAYVCGRWSALRHLLTQNRRQVPPLATAPEPSVQAPQIAGFEDYYIAIAAAYRVKPYPGPVDIFICDEEEPHWKWWYWKYFLRGRTSCHRVPGRHMELVLSPKHMVTMTQVLASALKLAQNEVHPRRSP